MNDEHRTPEPRSTPRRRRRWRAFALVAIVLVIAAVVVAVLFRDTPRRLVERTLARELQADVRVGRLEILGPERFALHDLVIREPAPWPEVEEIRIAVLRIEGAIGEIREARFDVLRMESPVVRVRVPPGPPPPTAEGARPEIGLLEVRDGTVVAVAGGGMFRARIDAILRDVPIATAGQATVTASADPIRPLVAVVLAREDLAAFDRPTGLRLDRPCDRLEVHASLESSGSAHASVTGACAFADARGDIKSIGFEARASATPADAGRDLEISAGIEPGTELRATGRWPDGGAPRWTAAELDVPDLGAALAIAAVLPAGADVAGEAMVRATRGSSDRLDVVVDGRIDRASGAFGGLDVIAAGGRIELRAELPDGDSGRPGHARGIISIERLGITGADFILPADLGPWRTEFEGEVGLPPRLRFAGGLELTAPGLVPLHALGEIRTDPDRETTIDVEMQTGRRDLARVLAFVRRVVPWVPAGFALEGDAGFLVRARGPIVAPALDGEIDGTAVAAAYGSDTTVRFGRLEARGARASDGTSNVRLIATDLVVALEGDGRANAATVTLDASQSSATALDLTVDARGLNVDVPEVARFEGGRGSARARHLADRGTRVEHMTLSGAFAPSGWPSRMLTIVASGDVDAGGRGRVDLASFELEGLARIEATAIRERRVDPVVGSVRLASADVTALRAWYRTGGTPLLAGYGVSFAPSFESAFRIEPDGAWAAHGTAGWTGLSIQSDDGARVLEGLDGSMEFDSARTIAGGGRLTATGTTDGFVMLWGRVFGDYAAFRPSLEARLRWGQPDGPAWVVDGRASLDDEVVVEARAGAAGESGMPWRIAVSAADLGSPFERWVRAPLVDSVARLDGIRANGGFAVAVEGTLSDDGSGTARGTVVGHGLAIEIGDTARVSGLDLDLPVDLEWTAATGGGGVRITGPARTGSMAFARLDVLGIPVRAVATELRVAGDTIGLGLPVEFDVLGGGVTIGSLTAVGLATEARRLEARIEVAGIRLDRLSATLGLPPLDGTLDAAFPSVTLTPDVLRVDGGGEVRVFGGVVRLGDISGENMLTRFPKLTLSAEFEDIDLRSVTRTFDFGEMTGIVRGHVRDCELFRSVPVRFDAGIETVARKGVRQSITVKAINNLTVLGTGGRANVFDRGIHRFLDRYAYDELGISARLQDDVFVLRGAARRGDRELFLKGKLPFRLDVVNVRPGQSVSFRTMLDRLSRLDLSSASTTR